MADNQATAAKGAVAKSKVRTYRQYMNRRGKCKCGRTKGRRARVHTTPFVCAGGGCLCSAFVCVDGGWADGLRRRSSFVTNLSSHPLFPFLFSSLPLLQWTTTSQAASTAHWTRSRRAGQTQKEGGRGRGWYRVVLFAVCRWGGRLDAFTCTNRRPQGGGGGLNKKDDDKESKNQKQQGTPFFAHYAHRARALSHGFWNLAAF